VIVAAGMAKSTHQPANPLNLLQASSHDGMHAPFSLQMQFLEALGWDVQLREQEGGWLSGMSAVGQVVVEWGV